MWPFNREVKENPVGAAFLVRNPHGWSRPQGELSYIKEGYQLNPVVFRCIKEITQAAAAISIELHQGENQVEKHPVLDLLKRPNPLQAWDQFLAEVITNRMLFGEEVAVGAGGPRPVEIWPLRPLDIKVIPGRGGMPSEYVHELNGRKTAFAVDSDGKSEVFFNKTYNPDNHWRGQSPLMSAALPVDIHNAGMKWNFALLKNGARPSGVVKFKGSPAGETIARLSEFFKKRFQGPEGAGEIPMLTDEADWVPMDHSPRDMDYSETMKEAKQLIAANLGVPLPLVDNDASSYNNMEQAKERFYVDTVIPLMEDFVEAFGHWLLPAYGGDLRFQLDLDSIPALESVRARNFERSVKAVGAQLLTREEGRELIGYEPQADGEFVQRVQPQQMGDKALAALAYG